MLIWLLFLFFALPVTLFSYNGVDPTTTPLSDESPSTSQIGICRPNENIQNQWDNSHYENINDEIEKPASGDGSQNSQYGFPSAQKTDIFGMNTIEGNLKVASLTIHLLCRCMKWMGYAKIEVSFRMAGGAWSSIKIVSAPFGPAWKSFTWDGLDTSGLDGLQVRLKASIYATGYGGWVSVDALYAEISYEVINVGIVRPNENIQNEWGNSDYVNINETTPDGLINSHWEWDDSKTDIFGMSTLSDVYKIHALTIHLYCLCDVYSTGHANIEVSYRFREGDWSSEQIIYSEFGPAWKAFTWQVSDARQTEMNELQIRLQCDIEASGYGGWVEVDTMYVEVEYDAHDANPEAQSFIGSEDRFFPDIGTSRLGFTFNTTDWEVEDAELLFSIQETISDPDPRYIRIRVDGQLIYEYLHDIPTGTSFMDSLAINELKVVGSHQIVIEIFDGSYGSAPHYKLNCLNISRIEFQELINQNGYYCPPAFCFTGLYGSGNYKYSITFQPELTNVGPNGTTSYQVQTFHGSLIGSLDPTYDDYFIDTLRLQWRIIRPDGQYIDTFHINTIEYKKVSVETDPEENNIVDQIVALMEVFESVFQIFFNLPSLSPFLKYLDPYVADSEFIEDSDANTDYYIKWREHYHWVYVHPFFYYRPNNQLQQESMYVKFEGELPTDISLRGPYQIVYDLWMRICVIDGDYIALVEDVYNAYYTNFIYI